MLDAAAIDQALAGMPGWSREDHALVRTYRRRDWLDGISLVNAVAEEAERRNHHPDVSITGYRNVTFRLTSHDAGGVTKRDLDLAKAIDELADR